MQFEPYEEQNYQSHCFNSDSEDSDEEPPTVAAGELTVMEQFV